MRRNLLFLFALANVSLSMPLRADPAPLPSTTPLAENTSSALAPATPEVKKKIQDKTPPKTAVPKKDNRIEVTSSTPVLIAAVKRGEAHGRLVGPAADKLKVQYKTESPLLIDAKVISQLDRKDCKLLSITLSQANVVGPKSKQVEDMRNTAQLAICEDGKLYEPIADKKPAIEKSKKSASAKPETKK